MAEIKSPDILREIQALVVDKLQVVSYKWLSRKFSVSSNDAKRILQECVEQNGSDLEVIYNLSGWLKSSPQNYHARLVSGVKLAELKKQFEDNCSVQVYSVQACVPRDPAAIWNAEWVQTEELFDQPSTADNCLRDNRFCGVLNSVVQRNVNGTSIGIAPLQSKGAGVSVSPKGSDAVRTPTIPQQQAKVQNSSSKTGQSPSVAGPVVKSESNVPDVNGQKLKAHTSTEKVAAIPGNNKKKVQNEKSSSGTGGSLANLWGRASAKSESSHPPAETAKVVSNPTATAEVQICAREAEDTISSDDDLQHVNHRRASNGEGSRKRRVVFDSSDEEGDCCENVVNLASPDPPKKLSSQEPKDKSKPLVVDKSSLNLESQKSDQSKIKQEKTTEKESPLQVKEDATVSSKSKSAGISLSVKTRTPEATNEMDKATISTSSSPKRRKVLKTRIDERGREVTEVVWEGEEMESKKADNKSNSTDTANNRPPVTKKSPAVGSNATSNPPVKAGAKKNGKGGGIKDAKQGNIMSFFKKV